MKLIKALNLVSLTEEIIESLGFIGPDKEAHVTAFGENFVFPIDLKQIEPNNILGSVGSYLLSEKEAYKEELRRLFYAAAKHVGLSGWKVSVGWAVISWMIDSFAKAGK